MSWKDQIRSLVEPDRLLMLGMEAAIQATATRWATRPERGGWQEGDPLRLLLAGYVGTRNTGADVRVEEMIRQIRHVLGPKRVEMTTATMDPKLSAGYFRGTHQVVLPSAYHAFLLRECPEHHGVIACEGSMFKSKFSNALTTFMAGALGMANAEHKLSVGYGAEAGHMDTNMEDFVERNCKRSLVMCRNEPSRWVLERLGIRTTSGADTAWTFEPHRPEIGRTLLEKAGWDGKTPVVAIAPINPFWWPVSPDLARSVQRGLFGGSDFEHYRAFYFHAWDADREAKLNRYLDALVAALEAFRKEQDIFPILIGMEQLDRNAAERMNRKLSSPVPLFVSDEYDMHQLVSVLWTCRVLISSRYHAVVTSMPNLVPSGGVTMDERIRNLMDDRSQPSLSLEVDDPELEGRVLEMLRYLFHNGEEVSEGIRRALPTQLERMGAMGIDFAEETRRVYPQFETEDLPNDPMAHLPSFGRALTRSLEGL